MESKNIIIRLLQDSDVDQINAFHNRIYGDDRSKEEFHWEFYNAPAGKALYIVAEDASNNKIVGTQCAIPIHLKRGDGRLILSAKSEDTLVDPDYRGMQLFEKMYAALFDECIKNGIFYIWGFTPALKPFLKIGFEAPYSHYQSLRVINIPTSYDYITSLNPKNTSSDKMKIFLMAIISKAIHLKTRFSSSALKKIELRVSQKVESNLEKLLQTIGDKDPGLFHINEDKSYIDWRINNNPNHNKLLSLDFYKDDELIANVIFNHHKDHVWYLIQALTNQNLPDKIQVRIARAALKYLIKTEKAELIRTWNFNTNEINNKETGIYKKAGLFYIQRGVNFVWKDLKGTDELLPQNFILSRIATQGVI